MSFITFRPRGLRGAIFSTASALTVAQLLTTTNAAAQTSPVPVRELAAPDAKTTEFFGTIFSVRQLSNGGVLVNDATRRQLSVLDANFSHRSVVVDSVSAGGQSYGPRPQPLIPYLADSTLFVDGTSLSLLVIDPSGKVSHVMSAPKPGDLRFLAGSASYVDSKGNLLYRAPVLVQSARPLGPPTPGTAPEVVIPDSASVLRANFDTRVVDTVGRVKMQSGNRPSISFDPSGKIQAKIIINPLQIVDEWAVLSNGTIAFVRGHDYHIDYVAPDGKTSASAKLPFDWKRLSDEDKQALIDSARTAYDKSVADAKAAAGANGGTAAANQAAMTAAMSVLGGGGGGGGGGGMNIDVRMGPGGGGGGGGGGFAVGVGPGGPPGPGGPGGPGGFTMPAITLEFVPLKEIADYYPAIRGGAVKADLDGNLWILPTTSAQSKAGEAVYDVVNAHGTLTQRVRMPLGRSIAGFGHNGVVYLMYKDGTNGWALERTKIVGYTRATD